MKKPAGKRKFSLSKNLWRQADYEAGWNDAMYAKPKRKAWRPSKDALFVAYQIYQANKPGWLCRAIQEAGRVDGVGR